MLLGHSSCTKCAVSTQPSKLIRWPLKLLQSQEDPALQTAWMRNQKAAGHLTVMNLCRINWWKVLALLLLSAVTAAVFSGFKVKQSPPGLGDWKNISALSLWVHYSLVLWGIFGVWWYFFSPLKDQVKATAQRQTLIQQTNPLAQQSAWRFWLFSKLTWWNGSLSWPNQCWSLLEQWKYKPKHKYIGSCLLLDWRWLVWKL